MTKPIESITVFDSVAASTIRNFTRILPYDGRMKNIKIWFPRGTEATTKYYFYINDVNIFKNIGGRDYFVGDADMLLDLPIETPFGRGDTLKITFQNNDTFTHTVFCLILIELYEDAMQHSLDYLS